MVSLNEIKEILDEHRDELKKDYGVRELGIFGSYIKDKHREGGDVDILVEFERPVGMFEFVGLKNYLSDLLGIDVDLVTKNALKPRIGEMILKEVVYV